MGKVILAVVTFFGCLLLFGGAREAWRVSSEKDWPSTRGTILKSQHFQSDGATWVTVTYQYEVEGTQYTDKSSIDADQTRSVPQHLRSQATIDVHYDPARPERSYLEHAGYESPIALTIFGGVVLLLCSPFLVIQALLLYAKLLMRKAEYHLREGLKALGEGQDEIDAMRARGEEISPAMLEREADVLGQAQDAHSMLKDMKNQISKFE